MKVPSQFTKSPSKPATSLQKQPSGVDEQQIDDKLFDLLKETRQQMKEDGVFRGDDLSPTTDN
jgi:hypothetical protein